MPSVYALKSGFQALLRPLVRVLEALGVTANQVTLFALAASVAMGLWIALCPGELWPLFWLGPFLFGRMALNAIDGMLAREYGQTSALGAWLNELGDVLADAALYLPLAFVPAFSAPWIVVVVILGIATEMAGVVAVQMGGTRRYDGPMGKSDRAFVFGLLGMLLGSGVQLGIFLKAVLVLMSCLLLVTLLNRLRGALKDLSD